MTRLLKLDVHLSFTGFVFGMHFKWEHVLSQNNGFNCCDVNRGVICVRHIDRVGLALNVIKVVSAQRV